MVTTTCKKNCKACHLDIGDIFGDSTSKFKVTAVPNTSTIHTTRMNNNEEVDWHCHIADELPIGRDHWKCEFEDNGCRFTAAKTEVGYDTVAEHEQHCLLNPSLQRHHEPLDIETLTQPFDVDDDGGYVTFCKEFRYLGSVIANDAADAADIKSRVNSAHRAFGALRACLFSNKDISFKAKKMAYETLVLSILLFGSECWVPLEETIDRTRTFHRDCVRAICNVTRSQQKEHRIRMHTLLDRCGLNTFREYVDSRQLGWLGHVARMGQSRLPRRFLTAWVDNPRPLGGLNKTYGHRLIGCCSIIKRRLPYPGVDKSDSTSHPWLDQAQDRSSWRAAVRRGCNMKPPTVTHRSRPRQRRAPSLPQYQPPPYLPQHQPQQAPTSPRIRFIGYRNRQGNSDRFTTLRYKIFYQPFRTITNQGNQTFGDPFHDWFFSISITNWNSVLAAHPDRDEATEFDAFR